MSVIPDYNQNQGLSHEQVSQIAQDALQDARKLQDYSPGEDPNLFSPPSIDHQNE